jgi:hypothetical protein
MMMIPFGGFPLDYKNRIAKIDCKTDAAGPAERTLLPTKNYKTVRADPSVHASIPCPSGTGGVIAGFPAARLSKGKRISA